MNFKRKLTYKDYKKKEYEALRKFFCKEIDIIINKKSNSISTNEELGDEQSSRVWLLFAKDDSKEWICLQVGQSKYGVNNEIESIFDYLALDTDAAPTKNSKFYEEVCPEGNGEKYRERLYSMIGYKYKEFKICFLDVDKYLGIEQSHAKNDSAHIINICKNQYAEAKIAFETMAVYWRSYSSGIDGQTIVYIAEHMEDF